MNGRDFLATARQLAGRIPPATAQDLFLTALGDGRLTLGRDKAINVRARLLR